MPKDCLVWICNASWQLFQGNLPGNTRGWTVTRKTENPGMITWNKQDVIFQHFYVLSQNRERWRNLIDRASIMTPQQTMTGIMGRHEMKLEKNCLRYWDELDEGLCSVGRRRAIRRRIIWGIDVIWLKAFNLLGKEEQRKRRWRENTPTPVLAQTNQIMMMPA